MINANTTTQVKLLLYLIYFSFNGALIGYTHYKLTIENTK
ncbi:hypothetical protein GNIT_1162 [Glaciecola nitratireducens FR1064]|uniref:Uncharacterized protein n=1 Tax=Glaciecola nitratireducens (strain JCM 12485 / KCTC 12276 / FR1064) TaxID=1085623 RepID=G4QK90_GLANF|nr:hypothetical protein GNIT_1162 [Glaciecola nitratireducens FR1064]